MKTEKHKMHVSFIVYSMYCQTCPTDYPQKALNTLITLNIWTILSQISVACFSASILANFHFQ